MDEPPTIAFHAVVHGRVQGVGFRYSATRAATRLGVTGWVRNDRDGTVEVWCEGDAPAVNSFLAWLEKGPPGSRVTQIQKRKGTPTETYRSFTIEY
jgi:acylphosphatase